jgi:hypothetical protein
MSTKHAALAAAIAAVLAAPVYAQTADCTISSNNLASECSSTTILGAGPAVVTNSSGTTVVSGTGPVVTTGVPSTSVTVIPSTVVAVPSTPLIAGGANVQYASNEVVGPAGGKTVVTRYWTNVPPDAVNRADFQRWTQLRP